VLFTAVQKRYFTPAAAGKGLQIGLATIYKFLYSLGMANLKPVEFRGSALEDLRAFPLSARREAGHQLDRVQNGQDPDDWKPMNTIGLGVKEIRIRDAAGAFRVIYIAKLADAVYVLHCFLKKTAKTSKSDLDLAGKRYRDLLKEMGP
jgi:phage-related protein